MDIREFPQVLFKSWLCRVVPDKYRNNKSLALTLKEIDTGEPIATATINMVDDDAQGLINQYFDYEHIPVYIKDYSENQGMLVALQEAGVVSDVVDYYYSGQHVRVPLVIVTNQQIINWYDPAGILNGLTPIIVEDEVMIPGV
tara:strand:+ start:165 stop:593 length:429 start_codon:yes stop_codon:yes gene_type:complete